MKQLSLPMQLPRRRSRRQPEHARSVCPGVRFAVWCGNGAEAHSCGHLHYRVRWLRRCLSRRRYGRNVRIRATDDHGRTWRPLHPAEHDILGKALGILGTHLLD